MTDNVKTSIGNQYSTKTDGSTIDVDGEIDLAHALGVVSTEGELGEKSVGDFEIGVGGGEIVNFQVG